MGKILRVIVPALIVLSPALASAHEVYVLDSATIARDIAVTSPNPLHAFYSNKYQFFFWGFICFVAFSTIFFMSLFHSIEEKFWPLLARLKKFAAPVARITLGLCLIASAYNQALFGPELPFTAFSPAAASVITAVLYVAGALITLGFYTRSAGFLLVPVLLLSLTEYGTYMATYANYFGEVLFVLMLGAGAYSLGSDDIRWLPTGVRAFIRDAEKYSWPILRVGFGISIMYAAFFAKFMHSTLALDTIAKYHLTNYFHFDPLFTVLGAFIIESLIGLFFIVGLEIRWNCIFFLFWLMLSLWYFGESVWPHLVLIGLNIAFLFHGYDRYTLEGHFFKKRHLEPVL